MDFWFNIWFALLLVGNPAADEWQRLWNVHMQICRLHYQRQTNHLHTGNPTPNIKIDLVNFNHSCLEMEDFCFNQQKHMPYFRRRMVWEIVNHTLLWCPVCGQDFLQSPFSSEQRLSSHPQEDPLTAVLFLGQTHTPAPQTRNQLFLFSRVTKVLYGMVLEHKSLPHSPLFQIFYVWCTSRRINIAAKTQHFVFAGTGFGSQLHQNHTLMCYICLVYFIFSVFTVLFHIKRNGT